MKVNIGPYPLKKNAKRKVKVEIHDYDLWSADHTMALVIYPIVKAFRDGNHTYGFVDDFDVPFHLQGKEVEQEKAKWNWVLNEMVWVFGEYQKDDFLHKGEEHDARMKEGLRLFGRYYRALWN